MTPARSPGAGTGPVMSPDVEGTLRVLWGLGTPDGCRLASAGRNGKTVDRLLVIPSVRTGRFMVSDAGRGGVTRRLLTSHNGIGLRRRGLQRALVASLVLTRAGRRAAADSVHLIAPPHATSERLAEISFPSHLRARLHEPEALIALGVREVAYHHSKPTLQMYDATGVPLAYAKLGWSDGTSDLVRHETAALQWLAERGPMRDVAAPRLTHHGDWSGHPYLVLEPLPSGIRSLGARETPHEAARTIAGAVDTCAVTDSPWWQDLVRRSATLRPDTGLAQAALAGISDLAAACRGTRWEFGAWHGDWTWWNVGRFAGTVYAWDWEHAADCAPRGFDDLHWGISRDKQIDGLSTPDALARSVRQPVVRDAERPDLLLRAYLVEMAVRSCEVSQQTGEDPIELHEGLRDALTDRAG